MLGKKMMIGLLFAAIILMAMGDEQKPQPAEAIPTGRQMNWNSQNFLDGSASMMAPQTGQAKSSSGFQSYAPQSLESDINRDGSYSAASSGGGDYGYEASPDTSYSSGSSYERNGEDSKVSSFVSALTAFLPIGLFMAAIVPNIITVSSGRRRRSEAEEARAVRDEATFPILDMISTFGVRALQEPECQSKVVCEIGRMGGLPEANTVQRALWLTANYVPERMSRLVGLDKLFRQIRSQQCSDLKCSSG